jgi:hypothetical protein
MVSVTLVDTTKTEKQRLASRTYDLVKEIQQRVINTIKV